MTAVPTAPTLAELATAYAESRDPQALERLRQAVRRSPGFDPRLDVESDGRRLLAEGAHADLVALVRARMPGAFFSPSAHALLGSAYEGLGDEVNARRERRTARLALDSILATGDGSAAHPWSVLRISDEYDVLRARGLRSTTQRLVTRDGRPYDRHHCDDGTEVWFDIALLDTGGGG